MGKITFLPVKSQEEIELLAELADQVWHEYFISILSDSQIDYMVEKFQSVKALSEQIIRKGYQYYILKYNGENAGYTGIKAENGKLFLSKLYVLKNFRGKGFSREAIEFLKSYGKREKLGAIWLTVNKYNFHSIEVYEHFGFQKIRDEVTDIGNNFVMDDYVMEVML